MHDGSVIHLNKLAKDWDPTDRLSATNAVREAKRRDEILTGLLYINENSTDLHELLETSERPLNVLGESELCPGSAVLEKLNAGLR